MVCRSTFFSFSPITNYFQMLDLDVPAYSEPIPIVSLIQMLIISYFQVYNEYNIEI